MKRALVPLVAVAAACAPSRSEPPRAPLVAAPGSPEAEAEPGPTPPRDAGLHVARLTGGVGNKVVASFDQLRAAVAGVGREIDECYRSTAAEGGWRENLLWDLDISASGSVLRVTPHEAEYWRGEQIVTGRPEPGLAACMDRALRKLVVPPPVRAGWVRLRFEI